MATVKSLICWGGKAGFTATMTIASPCVVTINNHGIRQYNGGTTPMSKGIVFSTTGALPTGLTAGVTYWARYVTDNDLHIYDTEAHALDTESTDGRIITTGTQSGTHTARGKYYSDLTSQEKLRYGAAGIERIYHRVVDWRNDRYSSALKSDVDVVELAEAYDDYPTSNDVLLLNLPSQSCVITPDVDGVKTAAAHDGVWGAGYRFMATFTASWAGAVQMSMYNAIVRDFSVVTSGASGVTFGKPGGRVLNMHFWCNANNDSVGCSELNSLSLVQGCVFVNFNDGFYIQQYIDGYRLLKNVFAKSRRYGAYVRYGDSAATGFVLSNICIGSVTANWFTQPTGLEEAIDNAGVTGDTPWVTTGGKTVTVATTDFVDYDNNDFRPAAKTSSQVLTGTPYYAAHDKDPEGRALPVYVEQTHHFNYDNETNGPFIVGERLSWIGGTGILLTLTDSGTNGSMGIHLTSGIAPSNDTTVASGSKSCDVNGDVVIDSGVWIVTNLWSVGAFEYDFGTPPTMADITLQNIKDGSNWLLYNATDDEPVESGTQSGTADIVVEGVAYTGIQKTFKLIVRKSSSTPYYKPYETNAIFTGNNLSIYVSQEVDTVAGSLLWH